MRPTEPEINLVIVEEFVISLVLGGFSYFMGDLRWFQLVLV